MSLRSGKSFKMAAVDTEKNTDAFQTILERLDSMTVIMKTCQDSIKTCGDNVAKCNNTLESTICPRLSTVEVEITKLKKEVKQLKDKQNELECYMKRDNLIFGGISESFPENCEQKVKFIIENKMQIESSEIKFQRVHRLGKKENGKTRPIIARFAFFGERQDVWKGRDKLKDSTLWIAEDYTHEVLEKRKILRPILRGALAQANEENPVSAYLRLDRLYIENKMYTVDTLKQLPQSLQPEVIATPKIGDDFVAFFNKLSPLSNFYPAVFNLEGQKFVHVEQYYQYKRAQVNGATEAATQIANTTCPYECKRLAKQVKVKPEWKRLSEQIMAVACKAKFEENPELLQFLKDTGDRTIIEARTDDKFWGAGLHIKDTRIQDQTKWPGKNKLGSILMELRQSVL